MHLKLLPRVLIYNLETFNIFAQVIRSKRPCARRKFQFPYILSPYSGRRRKIRTDRHTSVIQFYFYIYTVELMSQHLKRGQSVGSFASYRQSSYNQTIKVSLVNERKRNSIWHGIACQSSGVSK